MGTGIRVLPRFVPIEIKFVVGADIYKILKHKTVDGNTITIVFAISDRF